MTELLPTRSVYAVGDPVAVEVRGLGAPGRLVLTSLGDEIGAVDVSTDGVVEIGALQPGGYGVRLDDAHTAVEVAIDPRSVLRYGFVVDYRPGRDLSGFVDNLRRLHLTGVQFYDWAYRHADLLGGGEDYTDALDQPVSLTCVRSLIEACHRAGAEALGYAAVYAVGPQEWPKWEHDALLTRRGEPYALGDFLFVLDPAAPDWLEHLTADLADAVERVGFDGFHLDQYGYPKQAHRPDGTHVDVARSFTTMIEAVDARLPDRRLVFNNVNDFPTWSSAHAPQDAVYIEVWTPQTGLEHLAQTVTRARAESDGKPVVIAAYQHVYDSAPAVAADRATAFTMAALFSHGATQLLAGEADRILVDPYYVRNHTVETSTAGLLHRWYDFAVEHAELLFDPQIVEVTASMAGEYNDDLDVTFGDTVCEHIARAGTVWRRITRVGDRHVLHLINLVGQSDTTWDAPRAEPGRIGTGHLRVRVMGERPPRVRVADPDRAGRLVDVEVSPDGDHVVAELPEPHQWQVVVVDPAGPA